MTLTHRDSSEITGYHAHIYYDAQTRVAARSVSLRHRSAVHVRARAMA